jgi:hypothetical protein
MRRAALLFLLATCSTWSSLTRAEPAYLQPLLGEWHQIASNAGKCADCRITVEKNGREFIVKASNGWSAIVQPSFQGRASVAGKGAWKPDFGGPYGGKPFYLNLGVAGGKLLMLMTVPDPDGKLGYIKATFEKAPASAETL